MSHGKRGRSEIAHSLFPFLAVLLCTMGALILILMLIVRQAQESVDLARSEKEMEAVDLETKIQVARDGFEKDREEVHLEIERKRNSLQSLEEQADKLAQELKDLGRTVELIELKRKAVDEGPEATETKIGEVQKQLEEAADRLKKKLDNPAGNKPVFAIIPYEGTNGTHRRPIYLECRDNGITVQPEGILIPLNDLKPPYGPGNPLDATLRTIRNHHSPNAALDSSAYPLLIVRESGIRTYALARMAMAGWDDQFGYELVEDSLELSFPESEPALPSKIQQTLVNARNRQAALVMAMPQRYRQMIQQLSADDIEFHENDGRSDGAGFGNEELGKSGLAGTGSGFGGDEFVDGQGGTGTGGYGAGGNGTGSGYSGGDPFTPRPGQLAQGTGRGGFAYGEDGIAGGSSSGPSGSFSTRQGGRSGSSGGTPLMGFGGAGSGDGELAGGQANGPSMNGSSLNNSAMDGGDGSGGAFAGGSGNGRGRPGGSTTFGQSLNGDGQYVAGSGDGSGDVPDGQWGPGASGGSSSSGNGSASGNGTRGGSGGGGTPANGSSGFGGGGGGNGTGKGSSMNRSTAGADGGGNSTGSMSSGAGADSDPNGQYGGQNGGAGSSSNSNYGGDPSAQSMSGGASMGMGSQGQDSKFSGNKKQKNGSESIAVRKGRDWAYSGSKNGTPVVRSIRVVCYSDRWVVMPEQVGRDRPITVMLDVSAQKSADELARVMARRIEGWGFALSGGHWKPVLEVEVGPDGERRYQQLLRMMEGSGMDVRRTDGASKN